MEGISAHPMRYRVLMKVLQNNFAPTKIFITF